MPHPRQPEQRRSHRGGATPQHSDEIKPGQDRTRSGHALGTDRAAAKAGGGVPPDQRPQHP
ncbi:hypothetical protein [Streptomyces scabiei]|uniref:hypothetical protein n=1 Tax=Streptomyces scabiei TaxID=1930 RepID=UPI0029B82D7B|nr:hypothetical protein [Streptomyces scabiei]MDX3520115.1 hypothetical protein [Streptomyces scabiei]